MKFNKFLLFVSAMLCVTSIFATDYVLDTNGLRVKSITAAASSGLYKYNVIISSLVPLPQIIGSYTDNLGNVANLLDAELYANQLNIGDSIKSNFPYLFVAFNKNKSVYYRLNIGSCEKTKPDLSLSSDVIKLNDCGSADRIEIKTSVK